MISRLLKALAYLFGAIVISVMVLFISWAICKWVDLPYQEISINNNDPNQL
jgi:cell division septal protein FtsQ